MDEPAKRIAVVQGASDAEVQALLGLMARGWQGDLRLAGVLAEEHGLADRACSAGYLCSLRDGQRFAMFEPRTPGAQACHLVGDGVLAAAAAVRRDIEAGCDLVLLSKFGKLEATGSALRDAFAAAIEAGVPVLTSVSATQSGAWTAFASPLFTVVPADVGAIEAWRRSVVPHSSATTSRIGGIGDQPSAWPSRQ